MSKKKGRPFGYKTRPDEELRRPVTIHFRPQDLVILLELSDASGTELSDFFRKAVDKVHTMMSATKISKKPPIGAQPALSHRKEDA